MPPNRATSGFFPSRGTWISRHLYVVPFSAWKLALYLRHCAFMLLWCLQASVLSSEDFATQYNFPNQETLWASA
jgi:hypothetical protein